MNLKGSTGKDRIAAEYAKIYVECCDQPQALKRTFDSSGFSAEGTLISASAVPHCGMVKSHAKRASDSKVTEQVAREQGNYNLVAVQVLA